MRAEERAVEEKKTVGDDERARRSAVATHTHNSQKIPPVFLHKPQRFGPDTVNRNWIQHVKNISNDFLLLGL